MSLPVVAQVFAAARRDVHDQPVEVAREQQVASAAEDQSRSVPQSVFAQRTQRLDRFDPHEVTRPRGDPEGVERRE